MVNFEPNYNQKLAFTKCLVINKHLIIEIIFIVCLVNEKQQLSDGYTFINQIKSKLVAESWPSMMVTFFILMKPMA